MENEPSVDSALGASTVTSHDGQGRPADHKLVFARTLPHGVTSGELDKLRVSVMEGPIEDLHSRVDPLIGLVVADRYRIVEPLGRGGMGVVYKVEHVRIGKLLAMKLLAGELSRNQEVVRRFKTEALTASRLSSPNTVQVFDYGVSEGLTYLVMELVTGDDLGRVLRLTGNLPASRMASVAIQIGNALAEAHQKGIVHRDIKPENVMLVKSQDSELAKVLDFGLAKLREGSELSELTSQGAIVGTPYFMSPEQIRGDAVDARSDIYSLGALMFRGLTGIYPFNGPTPMSVFAKHLTEPVTPPNVVNPNVPPGMSSIVEKALAKDPADRFQRVEDFQSALVAELADLGASNAEALLDSGAIRQLEKPVQAAPTEAIATRDEVESYERKLKRTRYGVWFAAFLALGVGLAFGAHTLLTTRDDRFAGEEVEPNDELAGANEVPYGTPIRAMLGKRLSPTESDVDFFKVVVPPGEQTSTLLLKPLPNIPLCVQVFQKGQANPNAQYCAGRPNVEVEIPVLALSPGPYVLAVIQDLDGYGDPRPPVYENVSDYYSVVLGPAAPVPELEVEPNDDAAHATPIAVGQTVRGTLGWVNDRDIFCPNLEANARFRFRIDDDGRDPGTVLAASTIRGGEEGPAIRIHGDRQRKATATDVATPYSGITFQGGAAPCLMLRVVPSAQSVPAATSAGPASVPLVPRGSKAQYRVSLEPVP
jgi:serine/threonine-protein kinase